jgi:hypothetical protein
MSAWRGSCSEGSIEKLGVLTPRRGPTFPWSRRLVWENLT